MFNLGTTTAYERQKVLLRLMCVAQKRLCLPLNDRLSAATRISAAPFLKIIIKRRSRILRRGANLGVNRLTPRLVRYQNHIIREILKTSTNS